MKRRLVALVCTAALVVGLLLLSAGAANDEWDANVIFSALNDTPLPLNDGSMPIRVRGTIYVPYTMLISTQNGGVKLGVFDGGQSKTNNTLTLYTTKNLTFDLKTGLSYDYFPDGERQNPTAVIRNGQIYVSAYATASYFGLRFTQDNIVFGTQHYPYIRISSSAAVLSDAQFKDSVKTSYLVQLQNYYRTVTAQTGESGGESTPPVTTPAPVPEPNTDGRAVGVYLALRCDTGQATAALLDALKAEGRAALLLFPALELVGQDDLIRRAVGEGHVIGLITGGATLEEARGELAQGQELLSHIARTGTHIVLAEDGGVAAALAQEGWLCWRGNLSGLPGERGSATVYTALLRALQDRESPARITLDDSETSSAVLTRLLRLLREDRYDYRTAVETEF